MMGPTGPSAAALTVRVRRPPALCYQAIGAGIYA